jgi:hypothetical protein
LVIISVVVHAVKVNQWAGYLYVRVLSNARYANQVVDTPPPTAVWIHPHHTSDIIAPALTINAAKIERGMKSLAEDSIEVMCDAPELRPGGYVTEHWVL